MLRNHSAYRSYSSSGTALLVVLPCLLVAGALSAPSTQPVPDIQRIREAVDRSRKFLDKIAPKMNPVQLRRKHGMKGKKFLVEYLNAWWKIYHISDEAGRAEVRRILMPTVQSLEDPAYHDLAFSPNRTFKQDIISYLSACVLLGDMGLDTVQYRREISRIVARTLSQHHLRQRGIDNTMAIIYRLRQLGHRVPLDYCPLWNRPGCVTREHPDLTKLNLDTFQGRFPIYRMTHEIFYLTEFGKIPMQCVGADDLTYIRKMHQALIPRFIEKNNADALGELVMGLNYLKMTDLPEYGDAVRDLLDKQNGDGSWGDADLIARHVERHFKNNPRYLVDVGQFLHTTEVCLNAICYPIIAKPAAAEAK